MILKNEVFPIGKITKTHGTKGELNFVVDYDIFQNVDIPFIFMEPEGLFVPFYIENIRMKNSENGIIKLERIDSDEKASEYIGQSIYLPKIYMEEINDDDDELTLDYFIGFELIDVKKGKIGIINGYDDSTDNALFLVEVHNDEIMIPAADDFIVEIDHDKQEILMDLPLGLIDN